MRLRARALLVACCFAAGALGAPIGVYATSSGTPDRLEVLADASDGTVPVPVIAESLRACAQGLPQALGSGDAEDCMSRAFTQALRQGSVPDLFDTIESLYDEYPAMRSACHPAAHAAGVEWFTSGAVPVESFAQAAAFPGLIGDGCLFGVVHGFYDHLALNQDSLPDWLTLVRSCEQARENKDGRGFDFQGCTEGLGHLAWHVTLDSIEGPRKCLAFSQEATRTYCTLAVFMEEFVPRPEVEVFTPDRVYSTGEWTRVCRQLDAISPDLSRGCAAGAGYTRSRTEPILPKYQQVVAEETGTAEDIENVSELVEDAISFCGTFSPLGDTHAYECLVGYLSSLPRAYVQQPEVLSRYCDRPSGLPEQLCRDLRSME